MKELMTEQIKNVLTQYINRGAKDFVIFPYNDIGELTRHILRKEFQISELFMVDNRLCGYNSEIKDDQYLESYLLRHPNNNIHLIVASQNRDTIKYIMNRKLNVNLIELFTLSYPRGSCGPLVENQYLIESIGAFCSFAPGTAVVGNHPLNFVSQHSFLYTSALTPVINNQKYGVLDFNRGVVIGNDVWLGRNVLLIAGVKIGNGVRAAAGAVITKDIPDYAVVAGVPAKILKYRFTPEQIEQLNEIAWWDWPDEKIRDCYDDFLDIETFIQRHYHPKL